jgi:Glutamine amidotransferase domain
MCGIAGTISSGGIDRSALIRMGDRIAHRGPDGEGYLLASPGSTGLRRSSREEVAKAGEMATEVGFAHRRLTIIDLSKRSDQPLVDASGDYAIAYNGEVYNYVELREELRRLGHSFRSNGDTEVVLEAYKEWGAECVDRLVGMWAFAILDRSRTTRPALPGPLRDQAPLLRVRRIGSPLRFGDQGAAGGARSRGRAERGARAAVSARRGRGLLRADLLPWSGQPAAGA